MKETTQAELAENPRQILNMVEAGESVRIYQDGRAIADIVPLASTSKKWINRTVKPMVLEGVTVSEAIIEDRGAFG